MAIKKNVPAFLCLLAFFLSCKNPAQKDNFNLNVQVKNQKSTFLLVEKIKFDILQPEKTDTLQIKNGKASIQLPAKEQNFYRLVLPDDNASVFFINDEFDLTLDVDALDRSFQKAPGNTPLNKQLHQLLKYLYNTQQEINPLEMQMNQAINSSNQELVNQIKTKVDQIVSKYQQYLLTYADTCKSPVLSMFAFSNAQYGDAKQMMDYVQKLSKRFPQHEGANALLKAFEENFNKEKIQVKAPAVGDMAPDFTLRDTEDKSVSLSSFRGKYLLVDFWASWCGPCRGENPNVVAAYQKFKNKNFTVMGVSLDEKKEDWLEAIKEDALTWTHVSDLKGWESSVVRLFGFDGIPYNILLDPSGKILATGLREKELDQFLQKTLK